MIDLHAHVLPGLDDGPADDAAAVSLAAAAAAAGVRTMAATPHLRDDFPDVRPGELAQRVAALESRLAEAGVRLAVISGGEVDVVWAQRASDETLRAVSYGARGTDLLVETPYGQLPPVFEELLFRIRARGFRVLLAHPERNRSFQAEPARLARLVDRGTLVQLTAGSLTRPRSPAGKLARRLLADGRAHVLASDMHAAHGRSSLREALAATSDRRVEWMVTEAPAAILAGQPLPAAPASGRPRRRWGRPRV